MDALLGKWSITETAFEPQGAPKVTGSGTEDWYAATGGTTLVEENHTKSAKGDEHDTAFLWWDGKANLIRGLWCADINDEGCSGFSVGWEGSDVTMAGQWESGGQRLAWKEIFVLTGADAFTQTLYVGSPGQGLKPVSVIRATRLSPVAGAHAGGR